MTSAAPNSNPPAVQISNPMSPPSKRDLKSWWKGFKIPSKHQETHEARPQGIFGVPLRQSITYANVAISLIDERGQSYIYGYVPIVVAKCGVFLKEKATGVEGIFRLSGSEKRIKELKTIFDSPDRYGKGLVWDGYTVHDAANVLRRYLNDLPEPVVPLDLYEKFRDPLRGATKQAVGDAEGPQFVEHFNESVAIEQYQRLITELPPLNRQLLLYILDLLAVFAAKADENRMNSQNLAAIFQPGMLSHPNHAMAPEEYRLNQCVIIFLIENQDHFLIGMQGTAADEKTKKEVESGPTPVANHPVTPTPNRKTSLGRSASNASAGANSVRKDGSLRRNRSVSSRNSKGDGASTPNSPALTATPTGGLGRSNTVPSKRSPALVGGRFQRNEGSRPHSPAHLEPLSQLNSGEAAEYPQQPGHSPRTSATHLTPTRIPPPARSQEKLLDVHPDPATPSKTSTLPSLFQRSPTETGEKRQPNKLRKKKIPGSLNPSAQSSVASLPHSQPNTTSPALEIQNPLEHAYQREPEIHALPHSPVPPPIKEERQQEQLQEDYIPPASTVQHRSDVSSEPTPRASQTPSNPSLYPENTLKAKKSPPTSLHSSFNEGSDIDQMVEDQPVATTEQLEKEKKKRWRLSRTKLTDNGGSIGSGLTSPRLAIGSNDNADVSSLSISSSSHRPRKSESLDPHTLGFDAQAIYDSGRDKDEPKGPIGWIKHKYREAKETAEQRRNKSPPADRPGMATNFPPRGKSLDLKRETAKESEKRTSPPIQATSPPAQAPAPAQTGAQPQSPTIHQPTPVSVANHIHRHSHHSFPHAHAHPQSPPPQHQQQQPQQPSQQQSPPPLPATSPPVTSTPVSPPVSPPAQREIKGNQDQKIEHEKVVEEKAAEAPRQPVAQAQKKDEAPMPAPTPAPAPEQSPKPEQAAPPASQAQAQAEPAKQGQ